MICYKDKTWCSASPQCDNTQCTRHFGEAARDAARKWWGSDDAPVAFANYRETCGEFVPVAVEGAEEP